MSGTNALKAIKCSKEVLNCGRIQDVSLIEEIAIYQKLQESSSVTTYDEKKRDHSRLIL